VYNTTVPRLVERLVMIMMMMMDGGHSRIEHVFVKQRVRS
jgi:hypothetical protein